MLAPTPFSNLRPLDSRTSSYIPVREQEEFELMVKAAFYLGILTQWKVSTETGKGLVTAALISSHGDLAHSCSGAGEDRSAYKAIAFYIYID